MVTDCNPATPASEKMCSPRSSCSWALLLFTMASVDSRVMSPCFTVRVIVPNFIVHRPPITWRTRGVQKVHRLKQLTTRYAYHILSLFNIDTCNWNALGPAFLDRSDPIVEELLFLVFQPAICRAIRTRMVTVGDGVVQSRHFGLQPMLELTCDQMHCPGSKWLLFFS